jgi:hypothetical protein
MSTTYVCLAYTSGEGPHIWTTLQLWMWHLTSGCIAALDVASYKWMHVSLACWHGTVQPWHPSQMHSQLGSTHTAS